MNRTRQLEATYRYDDFGRKVSGQLGDSAHVDKTYLKDSRDTKRKDASKANYRTFRDRVEKGKKEMIERAGGVYTPLSRFNPQEISAILANPRQPSKTVEDTLKEDVNRIRAIKEARRSNLLLPTGLNVHDDILQANKKVLEPSLRAKTMTEKRASLAVIESYEEHDTRMEMEGQGLDLSYTALLTNKDGFGPKMDPVTGRLPEKEAVSPYEFTMFKEKDLEGLEDYADTEENRKKVEALMAAAKTAAKTANGKPLKLKLSKAAPAEDDFSPKAREDKIFNYSVAPLEDEELAELKAERQKLLETKQSRENLIENIADAPASFTSLATRFQDLVKSDETRAMLEGATFDPLQVPNMQDAWSVKNRDADRMSIGKHASEDFMHSSRSYDRLQAEFHEAELLEKLGGGSMKNVKLPGGGGVYEPPTPDEYDPNRQASEEDIRQAIEFERAMQEAHDQVYASAKRKLQQSVREMMDDGKLPPSKPTSSPRKSSVSDNIDDIPAAEYTENKRSSRR